jgi:hypothetical protein
MGNIIEYIVNCSCIAKRAKYPDPYEFQFDGSRAIADNQLLFESNEIRTSKYTLITFLPSTPPLIQRRFCCSSKDWRMYTS